MLITALFLIVKKIKSRYLSNSRIAKWVLMSIMKFCIVIKINVLAQEDLSCTVNKENTLQTTIHGIIPL